MPHIRHVAVHCAVYARSYPFQFVLPSLPYLSSSSGGPKDYRAKAEAPIAGFPWGTAMTSTPNMSTPV